jgi:hypothetical protein
MINKVHASYNKLADALSEASKEINQLLKGTDFHFYWEYPGFAAFTKNDNSIQVAATPGWEGVKSVCVQVTNEEGHQVDGTEDIADIILSKLSINEYVKQIKVVLTHPAIKSFKAKE